MTGYLCAFVAARQRATRDRRARGTSRPAVFPALLATIAIALAATACGGSSSGQEIVRERDGVRLTLSVNGDTFERSETVELRAVAENRRNEPLVYGFVPLDEPPFQLRVTSDLVARQIINDSDPPLETGAHTMDAGERLEAEAGWDQTLAVNRTPVQAPEGEYTITARLVVQDQDGGPDPVEITAAAVITLTGGEPLFPVDEAILTAIHEPDLRDWIRARDGRSAVCLFQSTDTYYSALLDQDRVDETEPTLYSIQLNNGLPVCSPVSLDGEWRVQFFASSGPEPRRVAVYMDIYTGENVRFEEGGLDPLPSE